jgi:tetratricopeptide (TPR) repeat protein
MSVEREPDYMAYNNLGNLYYAKGRIDEAIQHYLMAAEIEPDNYRIYYNLGIAYRKKGMHDKAREYFQLEKRFKEKKNKTSAVQ